MILVIDDVKSFPFEDVGKEVLYARTLAEGFHLLDEYDQLDELWLDHDLGGEDTIRPLVLQLAESAFNGTPKKIDLVVICSLNAPGADWIASTLERWYPVTRCIDPNGVLARFGVAEASWY